MEIWKDIKNYEGRFQISNLGNVRRLPQIVNNGRKPYSISGLNKRKSLNNYGYEIINLSRKIHLVHRLIAQAFIPNTLNLPCVNHIDGNKLNNSISNLEWCSHKQNNIHAYKIGLKVGYFTGKSGYNHPSSKSVIQFDLDDNIIAKYGSIAQASRDTGISHGKISRNARGFTNKDDKYKWKYSINTLQQ